MLRNFLTTLRYFKLASMLNIFGLSVAFASFIIIMMQVVYERGYGKDDPNYKEIYRVENTSEWSDKLTTQTDKSTVDFLTQREPKVMGYAIFDGVNDIFYSNNDSVTLGAPGLLVDCLNNSSDFFKFTLLQGSFDKILEPNQAVIPHSMAIELFPKQNPIGQTVFVEGQYLDDGLGVKQRLTVIGVYEDFPDNSALVNGIYWGREQRFTDVSQLYIRCQPTDTAAIIQNYRMWSVDKTTYYGSPLRPIRLNPIDNIYYSNDVLDYGARHGSRSTTNMLMAISLLVIVIASINFINFSTAMAPMRIKGLNTRLVFGQTKRSLRMGLVAEAVGLAICGYLLALIWIAFFNDTSFTNLIKVPSTLIADNGMVVWGSGLVVLLVGLLAGIYPAYYSTMFETAMVLKGSGGRSHSGKKLRTLLVSFQYVISIGLIIGSLFVALQNTYLRDFPLGFDKTNVYVVAMPGTSYNDRELFAQQLGVYPHITDVTFAGGMLGVQMGMMKMRFAQDSNVNVSIMSVDDKFLESMGIAMVEGRGFTPTEVEPQNPMNKSVAGLGLEPYTTYIFNRKAQQMYDLKLDSVVLGVGRMVGVVDNLHVEALYQEVSPMCFVASKLGARYAYVHIDNRQMPTTLSYIKACFAEMHSRYLFEGKFLDATLDEQYAKEEDLGLLINMFSILAILLSLMGVFGLVVFETQYRRKEIGLRKVYGSTINQILIMFNRKFVWIIAICFVIAAPLAYYGVTVWLKGFAFKTPIFWWVFVLALLIVLVITLLTVTIQSYRAATENPARSINIE